MGIKALPNIASMASGPLKVKARGRGGRRESAGAGVPSRPALCAELAGGAPSRPAVCRVGRRCVESAGGVLSRPAAERWQAGGTDSGRPVFSDSRLSAF